jgi:hypothetical protein
MTLPGDVQRFSADRGCQKTLDQARDKASEVFPGFRDVEFSLVRHPKDSDRAYIRIRIDVNADVEETLAAQHRFESWLMDALAEGPFVPVRVVPEYA